MPDENGWATGPEYIDNSSLCPYCGSDDIDGGTGNSFEETIMVSSGCKCNQCGKRWSELFSLQGWYDESDALHEDTRQFDENEILKQTVASFRTAVQQIEELTASGRVKEICRIVLEEGN